MRDPREYTRQYWEEFITSNKWCCETWMRDFDVFYGDVGPRPLGSSLTTINGSYKLAPGNARWTEPKKRRNTGGTPGPAPKLDEAAAREILRLGHSCGVTPEDIIKLVDGATLRDVRDTLAGRRYVIAGYDYTASRLRSLSAGQRVPSRVCTAIRQLAADGLPPEAIAARWGLPVARVYAILARV